MIPVSTLRPLPFSGLISTIEESNAPDFCLRPSVRDFLIHDPENYQQVDWMSVVVATLDLAKTFALHEILYMDPVTSEFRLLDSFKIYIGNPCHWVIGDQVCEMIPAIKGKVHFR